MKEAVIIGSGMIGGKATGYFKAKQHLEREDVRQLNPDLASRVRFPKTVCITTDCFTSFIKENNLLPEIQKYRWSEETAYDRLKEYFLQGKFSETLLNSFRAVLQKMTYPLAVRSSSVLEDRAGTSFAGKYLTLFISNRGTLEERLGQLCEAIKRVYAATYSPDALYYREKHDLLEETEQMAILLQQAVGREYEGNFLPLVAGVAFSQNGFLWNSEIKKEEGIVRLVFGLGTRAVGRGYARIFSPGKPMARPEGTEAGEITKFSQGIVDVLDLQNNCLKEVRATNLVKDGLHCYPRAQKLFSLREDQYLYTPSTNIWNREHKPVLTFDGVLAIPWLGLNLPRTIKWLFGELEKSFEYPVDIEFAVRVDDDPEEAHLYLVQCRPLSQREDMKPKPIPEVAEERKILWVTKKVPTGYLKGIEFIIYVDPQKYKNWPADDKYAVARMIGRLNHLLEGRVFALMGPGRWGTTHPELGIPVKYGEIANAKMLVEIAIKDEDYLPEVSYGTHFFQDLIESGCLYAPVFPGEKGTFLNEKFLNSGNSFRQFLKNEYNAKYEDLIRVIHIPELTGGALATAIFDGHKDQGLMFID